MNYDQLIAAAETQAGKWLLARVLLGMGVTTGAWYYGVVSTLASLAVGVIITYGDVVAFLLVSEWSDTDQGIAFSEAAQAAANLPQDATDAQKQAADLAQMQAFANLMALGTPAAP